MGFESRVIIFPWSHPLRKAKYIKDLAQKNCGILHRTWEMNSSNFLMVSETQNICQGLIPHFICYKLKGHIEGIISLFQRNYKEEVGLVNNGLHSQTLRFDLLLIPLICSSHFLSNFILSGLTVTICETKMGRKVTSCLVPSVETNGESVGRSGVKLL